MIELNEIRKTYPNFSMNLSMTVNEGCITGLVGKNGAGKSTLIKLLLGLIRPESGSITVLGKDRVSKVEKQDIGVSMAEACFQGELKIGAVRKILKKMYRNFDESLFEKKCREFGLMENRKVKELSTGMRAKLRVLIAVTHGAKLLILDEPTAGLDVEARNEILDMLREYMEVDEARSILITSHIATDLEGLCDDIYLIHEGRILLHEDVATLMEEYGVLKVSEADYENLEKDHILATQKEPYGYACFTGERRFYEENYPKLAVEKGGVDAMILMMTGGYR
ncbi:MAG: ABC transporter ATP-binding protein [Lachnospiraceae bacterium]|nr:ABC transporter ATP-binding protein [Lachnospiraceae bacterium]